MADWPQPGRQPVRGVLGVERARRELGDHGRDRSGRVRVHVLAVEGQELQHGRQRDLPVAAAQRPLPNQRVQQHGGAGRRVVGFAARPRLGQGVLGGGRVKQVKYLPGVQAERAAGDED
jgi:hypothetical protein